MDAEKEKADTLHARELAAHLRELREPLCPQFRLHDTERLYPVQGSCVLAGWPGWFMIPSIGEYQEHCTTAQFAHCCWFQRTGQTRSPTEGRPVGPPARLEVWQPPEVRRKVAA